MTDSHNQIELKVKRPAGVVLSVRVPGALASDVDDYAAARGLSLSETVRAALELFLKGGVSAQAGGVHGTTTGSHLILQATGGPGGQMTRGAFETREFAQATSGA